MAPSENLSPRSVLHFVEDEVPMEVSNCETSSCQKEKKRKLCLSLEGDDADEPCRSVNFRHRRVCDRTVQWLASAEERKLERLWLGPVFESPRTTVDAIETLPVSVTHLDLDLRNMLQFLPEILPLLFQKSHLTSLSIRLFGDSGAVELAKWMHLNPNLKRLDLRGNRISSEGLGAIVGAINRYSLALEQLDLSCNCIEDADPIRELLSTTTTLKILDLSFNWIGNTEVERLCVGLRGNTSLRRLIILGCHRVNQAGIRALLQCVQEYNASLHHIQLQIFDTEATSVHLELLNLLALNRAGRALLKSSLCAQSPLWPLVLSKSTSTPTILYNMLQQGGPHLFASNSNDRLN